MRSADLKAVGVPGMLARGRGRLVSISSLAGIVAFPTLATYGASKAALVHATAALQRELRRTPVRGAQLRYVEDVTVGELPVRYRGPLVTGDIIAWLMGNGRDEIFPYRLNWKNRQRMGGFYSRNEFGAWDSAMRVHWDDRYAQSVGTPRAYDYGMLRNAWLMQMVTDWMGDDAVLVAVDDRITGFDTLGDLTRLAGRVTAVDEAAEWQEVAVTVECTNQRDETTASGTLRVRLPSRRLGQPSFPEPPDNHGLLSGMPLPEEGPWARP